MSAARRAAGTLAAATGALVGLGWAAARDVLRATAGLERFDDPAPPLMKQPDTVGPEIATVMAELETVQESFAGLDPDTRRARARAWMDSRGDDVEHDCEVVHIDRAGLRGDWVVPPDADPTRRLLYVHGGAFEAGSPRSHRGITTRLAQRTGMPVFVVDYRLSPEHTRQEAIDDVADAWAYCCLEGPTGPTELRAAAVAGDSAGGNLALGLTHACRDRAGRLPDAVVAFSPATDFTFASPSWRENLESDPFLARFGQLVSMRRELLVLGLWARMRIRPDDPRVSPLLDDLHGLPPTLVQASSSEMLRDDAVRYARAATAAGSPVELQLWPGMVHVFPVFPLLPEAAEALDEVAAFLAEHTGSRAPAGADAG